MKRVPLFLLIAWLALMGAAPVLALAPGVHSQPLLFSVIKTDRSKNANVNIAGNEMSFTPGYGTGNIMHGFQPGSVYCYQDLVRVRNNSRSMIELWYALDGDLAALYETGVFYLGREGSQGRWEQHDPLPLKGGGITEAVNFYFKIPPHQQAAAYSGRLKWFAVVKGERPDQTDLPRTDGLRYLRILPGMLLFVVSGLLLYRRK